MSKTIRKIIKTADAPAPQFTYSQAVVADKTVYVAGQVGLDPTTTKMVEGVEAQTEQVLKNMAAILKAAGSSMNSVIKTTVLLDDITNMGKVNAIYGKHFTKNLPARAAYQVAALPLGAKVEIEAVAIVGDIEDQ